MKYGIWHIFVICDMKNDLNSEHSPTRLNILSKPSGLGCLFLIVMACLLSSSCSKAKTPPQQVEEKPLRPATLPSADAAVVRSTPEPPAAKPAAREQASE